MPDPEDDDTGDGSEEGPHLAGSAGDDVSAAISVSGAGAETMRAERREAGLRPVYEQGGRIGWGKDAESAQEQAGNDATGQSEKPTDSSTD